MSLHPYRRTSLLVGLLLLACLFQGCRQPVPSPGPLPIDASPTPSLPPTIPPTPLPPTATPEPLTALVNGDPITLAEFEIEWASYRAAITTTLADEAAARQIVLDDLIARTLLAQGARESGFVVDEAILQARLDVLGAQMGGAPALAAWQQALGYSDELFRRALRRDLAAAWMRDQIAANVPTSADQVHARQILLYNSNEADRVLFQLNSGADFAELATLYDPLGGGNLDWFPRGYLTEPAIEEAAFGLEAGKYSVVIQTRLGYHIVQVLERDAQHLLSPDARHTLQVLALRQWVAERRAQSTIQLQFP